MGTSGTVAASLALALWSTGLLSSGAFAQPPDPSRGQSTYKELCAKCHGATGKGDGKEAATLKTKPKDLTDCARMAKFSEEQLFRIAKQGGEAEGLSDDMPAYADSLGDDEIRDVVTFIRTLCPR